MKKAILILSLIAVSISTYAATVRDTTKVKAKTDTLAKKATPPHVAPAPPKQFQLDPYMVYDIHLQMTGQQIVALTGWADGSIEKTPNIMQEGVDNYRKEAEYWYHVIRDQEGAQNNQAYKKWAADTGKVKVDTLLKPKAQSRKSKAKPINQN